MQPATKKLGEMLVEAQLITPGQLQDALTHQRIAGGRVGSNLVALGFISEDVLMDFLAQKTGVPRVDPKSLDVPINVLQRIPRRLAEQLNVLPVSIKEPKSLVLAMADPSDLNAIDSARFASGMNIEPVVAAYTALKVVIPEQYRKLTTAAAQTIDVGPISNLGESLPVPFDLATTALEVKTSIPPTPPAPLPVPIPVPVPVKTYGSDPFFDLSPTPEPSPFSFFNDPPPEPSPATGKIPEATGIIHERSAGAPQMRSIESFKTRSLVLGLIRLLQRRGVIGEDELQRFLINLVESGEMDDDGRGNTGML